MSAAGNTDSSVPPTFTAVGTKTPVKPSCSGWASGTFTTPWERKFPDVPATNGVGWLYTTWPRASVTLNTGAYPCPIRYTFAPSTDSGRLTSRSKVRAGPPGCSV